MAEEKTKDLKEMTQGEKEIIAVEYQKAQDSAEHHDSLVWTTTSIIWGASLVLLGFVLQAITPGKESPLIHIKILMTLICIFGIMLIRVVCKCMNIFAKVREKKYEKCKELELSLGFSQHRKMEYYPKGKMRLLYVTITRWFYVIWVAVIIIGIWWNQIVILICKLCNC